MRRIQDLPGPSGLPLIGSLLQTRAARLHQDLEAWQRQYGDFFRFSLAGGEMLVVADPAAVGAILRDRPDGFERTRRGISISAEMGFDGVFSANGERWRRQRPMVMAGFAPAHIRSYFPTLVKVTDRLAQRWTRACQAGKAIDLLPDLMRFTVDVTAGLAFGVDMNTLQSETEVIQTHLDKVFPAMFRRLLAPLPYWRYVKLPADRHLDRHLEALHRAVEGFIRQARRRLDEEPQLRDQPENLIQAMIAARDADASGLQDRDVAANVLTMLLAGEDTTANTLAWMIYLLHGNPGPRDRARAAVRRVLGNDAYPTRYEQLADLDYVEACAHESLRLKPVAPMLPLQAARDGVVGDIEVPKGTIVLCLLRPAAVDPGNFSDAAAFQPERWQSEGSAADSSRSARRVVMPFGGGPRICPGRYLALQEIKMVMGMLFGSFDIDSVMTADGGPARERLAFTMGPEALRLRLRKRSPVLAAAGEPA